MRRALVLLAVACGVGCASARTSEFEVPQRNPYAQLGSTDPLRVEPRDRFVSRMRAQHPGCSDACFASPELPETLYQHELADVERAVAACCTSSGADAP